MVSLVSPETEKLKVCVHDMKAKPIVCVCDIFRGYYVVVVPLKKQRGKFLNPWEEPDQMNLDEVGCTAGRSLTLIARQQSY